MCIDQHDKLETRCRLLGHPVPFKYCRMVADGLPCRHAPSCWHSKVDVDAFLRLHFTQHQIEKILAPPMPKIASIVDLIEKAKAYANEERPDRTSF